MKKGENYKPYITIYKNDKKMITLDDTEIEEQKFHQ